MGMTDTLKNVYEKIPKGVKYAFGPLFIRFMVKNKTFVQTWKELDQFDRMGEAEKKAYQLRKLRETLIYAYEHVPHYRKVFDDCGFDPQNIQDLSDIQRLPLLEKDEAVALGSELYSTDQRLAYYKTFTGGSSGQALTVLLDKASIYKERAVVTHYLSKFGYDPLRTRTVAFWGHNKDQDYYYSPLKNEIVISPFRLFREGQLEPICGDIEKFKATYVMGYPSAIYLFAQMLKKAGNRMRFSRVVYYAENCAPEEKAFIEEVLGCPVESYYGHTERACFAEIRESGCVFNDYYGLTELLPTENEKEFRIVCTGFLSRKMPLIRYATDDVVQIDEKGAMHLVGHKRSEVHLVSKNGQEIFKGAMTLHVEELRKIKRYQYVQSEPGKADLCIVQDEPMTEEEISRVREYIRRRCEGLLEVEIKFVDEVQLTARGKYSWAVNRIK